MKFHLNYSPPVSPVKISHHQKILLVGSCFAENIGNRLSDHRFDTLINPSGILFNPISIARSLNLALKKEKFDQSLVIAREGQVLSYLHHSEVSADSEEALLKKIKNVANQTFEYLEQTNFLIITFGTASVFTLNTNNEIVANCHKQPNQNFSKKRLTVEEIVNTCNTLIQNIREINPEIRIIFTVSPVKYLREGIEENSLSKATLLLAANLLVKENKECCYFPAFELVNDDLRDHRFYKEDLAHPNDLAISYIWEKFSDCFFDSKTIALNKEIHHLNLAKAHRPMNASLSEKEKHTQYIEDREKVIAKTDPALIKKSKIQKNT